MRKAHLVGSVPHESARTAMTAVANSIGPMLDRVSDGETGPRLAWIRWQRDRIANCSALMPSDQLDHYGRPSMFKLRPGAKPEHVTFDTLGYADAAAASFATFHELQGEGIVPSGIKFQVNLPTPLGIAAAFFDPSSQEIAEAAIETAMLQDLRRIVTENNPAKLAIQWDVAIEFAILKAGLRVWFDDLEQSIVGV